MLWNLKDFWRYLKINTIVYFCLYLFGSLIYTTYITIKAIGAIKLFEYIGLAFIAICGWWVIININWITVFRWIKSRFTSKKMG